MTAPSQTDMNRLERVLATLHHQPVDRCALLEQLSYNPRVIAGGTGKRIDGFGYTVDDICAVIRQTCDPVMPPAAPRGTARVTSPDGFVTQNDNWTNGHVSRPFTDAKGARDWLLVRACAIREAAGRGFCLRTFAAAVRAGLLRRGERAGS